ncbi:MAG: sulfite exporter TauE/SafE family protein [Actinobacteria bacterium]|nr:sulfite exporter TauE/SafE family protein [Actinomycetota bacterium]
MTATDLAFLLGAGALAGAVGTVVNFASLVSYPALLAVGLPPVTANVTNTVGLVFAGLGSAAGSRPELVGQRVRVRRLGLLTGLGGACGAALLLLTPARGFELVVPGLVAVASLVLLVQPRLGRFGVAGPGGREDSRGLRVGLLVLAVYTGYFGAAGGVLTLAILIAMLDEPLARINAMKNAVAGVANAVAAVGFMVFGPVRWGAVAPLAAGFLLGGLVGPALVRRLPGGALRWLAGGGGLVVAAVLAARSYG